MFAGLLQQFPEEQIYSVGLSVLQFPPTWANAASELNRVFDELRKPENN